MCRIRKLMLPISMTWVTETSFCPSSTDGKRLSLSTDDCDGTSLISCAEKGHTSFTHAFLFMQLVHEKYLLRSSVNCVRCGNSATRAEYNVYNCIVVVAGHLNDTTHVVPLLTCSISPGC